jgi:methyl-accepting chemotaxis protein
MSLPDLLFPPRLLTRAFDDLHRMADAITKMPPLLDALRREFGGSNDEIRRLRDAFTPELAAIREAATGMQTEVQQLTRRIDRLDAGVKSLAADADEIREVVEPLEPAAERLGRLAERFPGPGRKD